MPTPGLIDLIVRGRVRHAIAEHVTRADVLHLHGVWDPLLLGAAAESAASRSSVCRHAAWDARSVASRRSGGKNGCMACGVRWFLNRAAALHLLNRDEAALITALRLPRLLPSVVPNGVDLGGI